MKCRWGTVWIVSGEYIYTPEYASEESLAVKISEYKYHRHSNERRYKKEIKINDFHYCRISMNECCYTMAAIKDMI